MKESTLKRFLRLPKFDEHLEMHRLDCLSSHGDLSLYDFVGERLRQTPAEEIRPKPLLSGDDLIGLGYSPGPQFREILAAIEDAQLEGATQEQGRRVGVGAEIASFHRPAESCKDHTRASPTRRMLESEFPAMHHARSTLKKIFTDNLRREGGDDAPLLAWPLACGATIADKDPRRQLMPRAC